MSPNRRDVLQRLVACLWGVPVALSACGGSGSGSGGPGEGDAAPDAGSTQDAAPTPSPDAAVLPPSPDAGDAAPPPPIPDAVIDPGDTLTPERLAVLAAVFDALIPGDEASPGAALAQAAEYLRALLAAFDGPSPRIFAGGPYSGRHGGLDGFSTFVPLTRVEEIAWRMRIEGSQGRPEREFNGPYEGFRARYARGLDTLADKARTQFGQAFETLTVDVRRTMLRGGDAEFLAMAYEHAVEGTYGDPVYGGNFQMRGWAAIDFEGDRQPIGYSADEMLDPTLGPQPSRGANGGR